MRSEHLKEHRLTHNEGRLFECYMCDTKFSAKSSLYVHIKKHQNRENNAAAQNRSKTEEDESVKSICEKLKVQLETSGTSEVFEQDGGTFQNGGHLQNGGKFEIGGQFQLDNEKNGGKFENGGQFEFEINKNTSKLESNKTGGKFQNGGEVHNEQNGETFEFEIGEEFKSENHQNGGKSQFKNDGNFENNKTTQTDNPKIDEKFKYLCAVDTCNKFYASKSSLKSHMSRVHGLELQKIDDNGETLDYVFYEFEENCEEEVNEGAEVPSESHHKIVYRAKKGQGAARTGLTIDDVWRLKRKAENLNPVGPSDVVLGGGHLVEGGHLGLLLTEELPSMFYQDELGGECQIMMLGED